MAAPCKVHMTGAKRMARYTHAVPKVVVAVGVESEGGIGVRNCTIRLGGMPPQSKSTRGGVLTEGGKAVKTWSSTQLSRDKSWRDRILHVDAWGRWCVGPCRRHARFWLGAENICVCVWLDSSAATAIAGRLGLGRTLHIEVCILWRQEIVCHRRFDICKKAGDLNPADDLSKPKPFFGF